MKKGFRLISLTLISILLLSLALPAAGFADSPFKGNGNMEKLKGYERQLKGFTELPAGQLIKFNGSVIKFDTTPVNKGGRILIPIRVLEVMGLEFNWEDPIVTITNEDDSITITFDLDTGEVEVDGVDDADMDVPPALHNNRTFVPLRWIAETFGLKVGYNPHTGQVDIDEEDDDEDEDTDEDSLLDPDEKIFADKDAIEEFDVEITLDDEDEFDGIKGLVAYDEEDEDADEEGEFDFTYDADENTVTFEESYLEDLDYGVTELEFQFEDSDDEDFTIIVGPYADPAEAAFEDDDITITFENLGEFEVVKVKGLDSDDYDISEDGDEVTLLEDYLDGLDEDTELKIILENDDEDETEVLFTVEI